MDIDPAVAAALGWPKAKYLSVERERRWLCDAVPLNRVVRAERLTDLYIDGTQLRLREAVPVGGGEPMRRLGRKADVSPAVRLLTSIYLSQAEFDLLARLPGRRLRKTRFKVSGVTGPISVDQFADALSGLILAEVEFDSDEAMAAFPMPEFCKREVTADIRFTGGWLVENGLPSNDELR